MRIVILKTSIRKTFTGTLSLLPDIREYAGVKIWKLILILTLITNIDYIHREGTQPHPSTENWIKDLLSMVPPIRTRPSLPHSQFLPLGSLHSPLTYQRGDRMKTIITEPNWSHRSQPCLTQWNYETPCRPPKMDGTWWRVLTKHGPLEKGMANHFSIPGWRTPWTLKR